MTNIPIKLVVVILGLSVAVCRGAVLVFDLDIAEQVEGLVDVAIAQGWTRIAFLPTSASLTGTAAIAQSSHDSACRAALNLTLPNHNLNEWSLHESQAVIAIPLTQSGLTVAGQAASSAGIVPGAGAALLLLSHSCPSGSGTNDADAAQLSRTITASTAGALSQPPTGALPLPPLGSYCVRKLSPEAEALHGSNLTEYQEAWLRTGPGSDTPATIAAAISLAAQFASVRPSGSWRSMPFGPLAESCGTPCGSSVLRTSYVYRYTADPASPPHRGRQCARNLRGRPRQPHPLRRPLVAAPGGAALRRGRPDRSLLGHCQRPRHQHA